MTLQIDYINIDINHTYNFQMSFQIDACKDYIFYIAHPDGLGYAYHHEYFGHIEHDEVEIPVSIQEELKHMNNDENERYKRHDHGHQFKQHNSDLSMIFFFKFKNCESINLFSKFIYF